MENLALIDLAGLDPSAFDDTGNSPNHFFYKLRDRSHTAARELDAEEQAWRALLISASHQNHRVPHSDLIHGPVSRASACTEETYPSDEEDFVDAAEHH